MAPRRFAWQAWRFQHRRFDLRGRRGTFATYIEVCGSPATTRDTCGAAAFCVAGVTLSAPEVRFAWQAWYFRYLHRGLRKSGDEPGHLWRRGVLRGRRDAFSTGRRGTFATYIEVCGSPATNRDTCGAAAFCVAGVTLSAPEVRFAWQAWYFRCLHRGLRKLGDALGRIGAAALSVEPGTFNTSGSMRVAGVALSVPPYMSAELGDELGRIGAAAFYVAGVTLSAPQARFAWQAWRFPRPFPWNLALSTLQARCAWQAWHFQYLHTAEAWRRTGSDWRRGILRGRRDAFSTSGPICVAGVTLSGPP